MRKRHKKLPEGTFTATIHALSHDGRGIASVEGKTTFIPGTLPGEEVEFEYTFTKSSFDEGKLTEVKQASKDRVEPKCPHANICGGCSLQHLNHEVQLHHKENTLMEQFKHFGQVTPEEIIPAMQGPIYQYRRKARLGIRNVEKKGLPLVGFREKNGRYLAVMEECSVLHPSVGEKIMALRSLISLLSCPREIPQIEVAIGDDETVLILRHLAPLTLDDLKHIKQFSDDEKVTIYLQPKKMKSIHTLAGSNDLPLLYYTLPDHDLKLYFHPTDFTQVNTDINKKMVNLAIELLELTSTDRVLDLFCGLGNFTLAIAKQCAQVTGIEGSQTMVERGYYNAKKNHIDNADFYECDLSQDFMKEAWAKQRYDKLLIDPPRSGAEEVMKHIPKLKPKRIVYVSCNPATLARDAGTLVNEHGYRLEKAGIMDMFPHTSHVESIAIFTKN